MNQRDQAHAYRFLARRLSAALVSDDPDGPDAPMRRLAVASFGSVMVAALAVAGVGIFGVLRPGGATVWEHGGVVILEKETGNRYVYSAGELHEVLNYSSARLLLGQPTFSMVSVSQASLRGVPVGPPIGIAGAPDELPTPATLVTGPWSVCSLPAQDPSGAATAYVRLTVGRPAIGSALPSDRGVLVVGLDGTPYLIWNGMRFRIPGGQPALEALGYGSTQPVVVGAALLDAVPQGPDLEALTVADLGKRGPTIGGIASRIGQVYAGTSGAGSPPNYYLAERGGVVPLTDTEAQLMLADRATAALYPQRRQVAISVPEATVSLVNALPVPLSQQKLPSKPPTLLAVPGGQGAVCAVYRANVTASAQIRTLSVAASPTVTKPPAVGPNGPLADQVQIAPGHGVVAQAVPTPGQTSTVYLITSEGIAYKLTYVGLLQSLGLPDVKPVLVSQAVLYLLRTGPTLDRNAAARVATP